MKIIITQKWIDDKIGQVMEVLNKLIKEGNHNRLLLGKKEIEIPSPSYKPVLRLHTLNISQILNIKNFPILDNIQGLDKLPNILRIDNVEINVENTEDILTIKLFLYLCNKKWILSYVAS